MNKINYRILLEAIIQAMKPILTGILIAIAVSTVFLLLLAVSGKLFPVVLIILSLLTILSMLIKNNYDLLLLEHRRNQKEVMDILKKMSNSYINIRFGHYHFQVTYDPLKFSWSKNDYWLTNKPTKWFEIYEFFWYKGY